MNTIRQNKNIVALNVQFNELNYKKYICEVNHPTLIDVDHYDINDKTHKFTILGFASSKLFNSKIDGNFTKTQSGFRYHRPYRGVLLNQDAIDECFGYQFYSTFFKNYLYKNPTVKQTKDILSHWAESISLEHAKEQIAKSMKNTSEWQRNNIKALFEKFTQQQWSEYLKHTLDYGVELSHYNQIIWKLSIHGFAAFNEIAGLDYQPNTFCPTYQKEIGYQAICVVFGDEFNNIFSNTDNLTPIYTFGHARAYLELWYHAILRKESEQKEKNLKENKSTLNRFVNEQAKERQKNEKRKPMPTKHTTSVNDITPDDIDNLVASIKRKQQHSIDNQNITMSREELLDNIKDYKPETKHPSKDDIKDYLWINSTNRIWTFKDRNCEANTEVYLDNNIILEVTKGISGKPFIYVKSKNCPCCNYPQCDHAHEDKGQPELAFDNPDKYDQSLPEAVPDYPEIKDNRILEQEVAKVNLAIDVHDLRLKGSPDNNDDEADIDAVTLMINKQITQHILNKKAFSVFQFKLKDTAVAIHYWFMQAGHDVYLNHQQTRVVFIHR